MKWAPIFLAAILMSSSLWAGTVTDDFEDGNFEGWRPSRFALGEQAEWIVEQGELVFTSKNFCRVGSALGIGDETWSDYEFSVQFSLRRTFPICSGGWMPSLGIGIDSNVAQTGTMKLEKNQWVIAYLSNQEPQRGNDGWKVKGCEVWLPPVYQRGPDRGSFTTEPRKWYTLKIHSSSIGASTRYEAFINETPLCDFNLRIVHQEGNRLNKGGALLYVRNAEVRFDNVVITGDNIPNLDMNEFVSKLSVSPGAKLTTTWGGLKADR